MIVKSRDGRLGVAWSITQPYVLFFEKSALGTLFNVTLVVAEGLVSGERPPYGCLWALSGSLLLSSGTLKSALQGRQLITYAGSIGLLVFAHLRSCRHIVRNSSQKPVTASHAMAIPTVTIRGWLKLVRSA